MNTKTQKLVVYALFAALAFVVACVQIPVVLFLDFEAKDVILTIGGFLYGPLAACVISVVVSLVEMVTISDTGIWGCLMNILSSCVFAGLAALIYKKRRTLAGATFGLVAGALAMTAAMLLWNYLITPLYMNVPREQVAGMLASVFLPFNLLKGGLNAALTMLLYRPLSAALRRAGLLPATPIGQTRHTHIGALTVSLLVLISGVLAILAFRGII